MTMKKKPNYSLEFKQDAVQLVLSKGYSVSEAATSLGVSASALRKWIQSEKGGIGANRLGKNTNMFCNQLTLSEHEELLRLRKENTKLRMEREILKKAAAFFAQEQR